MNMNNTRDDCRYTDFQREHSKTFMATLLVSPVAIVLNVLTIVAIRSGVKHLNCHYLLVIQQCLTDAIFAFSYIPMLSYFLFWCSDVLQEHRNCLNATFMNFVNASFCIVIINLIAIASDHFIAIYNPMKYQIIVTKSRVYSIIGLTYGFYVLTMATPFIMAYARYDSNGTDDFCGSVSTSFIFQYHATILFFLSVAIIIPIYIYVFCRARMIRNQVIGRVSTVTKNYKKSMTSLLIIITFKVCFILDLSLLITEKLSKPSAIIYYSRLVTFILPLINCICDPVIYAIRLPKVRHGYKIMCHYPASTDGNGRSSSRSKTSLYSLRKSATDVM